MNAMEYRGTVKVPGIDIESAEAEQLLDTLNERYGDCGPVLGGAGDGVDVILATDQEHEDVASATLLGVVMDALLVTKLPLRPESIELERAA